MIRYNATDADLWRRASRTSYWLRDIWILPIHRRSPAEHWVLCIIYPEKRLLLLFDSLVGQRAWKHEVSVSKFIQLRTLGFHLNG